MLSKKLSKSHGEVTMSTRSRTTTFCQPPMDSTMTGLSAHDLDMCSVVDLYDRNGWGVTPVDALSTAIVVEDAGIVKQILEFIPDIDFTTTKIRNESISVFETNIRYLGGLISGGLCSIGISQNH